MTALIELVRRIHQLEKSTAVNECHRHQHDRARYRAADALAHTNFAPTASSTVGTRAASAPIPEFWAGTVEKRPVAD